MSKLKNKIYVVCYMGRPFIAFTSPERAIDWLQRERGSVQINGMGWTFTGNFTLHEMDLEE